MLAKRATLVCASGLLDESGVSLFIAILHGACTYRLERGMISFIGFPLIYSCCFYKMSGQILRVSSIIYAHANLILRPTWWKEQGICAWSEKQMLKNTCYQTSESQGFSAVSCVWSILYFPTVPRKWIHWSTLSSLYLPLSQKSITFVCRIVCRMFASHFLSCSQLSTNRSMPFLFVLYFLHSTYVAVIAREFLWFHS